MSIRRMDGVGKRGERAENLFVLVCVLAAIGCLGYGVGACGSGDGPTVVDKDEITNHEYPGGVECYVYDSPDDSGSGISCVVKER